MAMTTKPWNAPGLLREGETAPQYMNQQLSSAPGDGGERNVIVDHMLGHQPVKPQQDSGRNASRYMYTINESSEYQQVFTRTVIGLAISEPYWMNTDFLFPLKYSQIRVYEVSSITVNNPLQTEIPYLAYPKVMHEKRTKRAYASKRYGSAATFEMTYLGTPEGNETFRRKMAQMSNQMRRQAAWKAQAALIEPDKEETLWLQWFGARDYTSFCGALQREVDDFALVNKDQLGMSKLMNKYSKYITTNANITPNGLMVDMDVMTYLRFEPPRTTVYALGGPEAVANVNTEENNRFFNGCRVVSSLIYKPEDDQPGSSPLTQSLRRVGSHYVMDPVTYYALGKAYVSEHRTIALYDEDRDSWSRITLLDTLRHWARWNKYGMLRADHTVMAGLGDHDSLFLYKVEGNTRNNDVYLRVARNFGLMEAEFLNPTALHAVATSSCKALTEGQMQAIRRGISLYERILNLPIDGAFADPVLNGKASYAGLYAISRARVRALAAGATGDQITQTDIQDAGAFIDAWGEFYHMMVARFGGLYNPCLDPRKVPKWMPVNNAGVPRLHNGPLVMFETTVAHDTGVYVSDITPRGNLLARAVAIGDFKPHDAVKFNAGSIIDLFERRFRYQEEGVPEAMNIGRNMQAIATYYDYLSADPVLQEFYAYFLFTAVHGDVQWRADYTKAAAVAASTRVSAAAQAVTLPTRDATAADGAVRFTKFVDLIGWLQSYVQAVMRQEFTIEDHEYFLRFYLGQMKPVNTDAAEVFSPYAQQGGDGRMLTPADRAGKYLTPESNFTTSDDWTGRPQANQTEKFFRGVSDAFAHFYDDKGDVVDFLMDKPSEQTDKRSRIRVDALADETQADPREHHHFTHESFPFAQKNWREKYEEAVRQEPMPWERAARIVFLAAPIRYQTLDAMIRFDVQVPIKVRLFQPWKGWVMYTAWLFAGGEATGITTYGWMNTTTSIDGFSKSAFINTTWELNCVVFAPERIVPISFLAHAGYQGGNGTEFFTLHALRQLQAKQWIIQGSQTPSLIAVPVPAIPDAIAHAWMDLRGDISGDYKEANIPHYPTFRYERRVRGFGVSGNMGNPYFKNTAKGFKSIGDYNTIMWRGSQWWNGLVAGAFSNYTTNTGHGGIDERPGVAKIRRGKGGCYEATAPQRM